jgi:hypothetical protein
VAIDSKSFGGGCKKIIWWRLAAIWGLKNGAKWGGKTGPFRGPKMTKFLEKLRKMQKFRPVFDPISTYFPTSKSINFGTPILTKFYPCFLTRFRPENDNLQKSTFLDYFEMGPPKPIFRVLIKSMFWQEK